MMHAAEGAMHAAGGVMVAAEHAAEHAAGGVLHAAEGAVHAAEDTVKQEALYGLRKAKEKAAAMERKVEWLVGSDS